MQPVPPVNIIMSFDYKVMKDFQEYNSLAIFRKDHKDAEFFDNAPMSIFVSLTHQLGLSNSKKGALIELEFLDPDGTFEEKVLRLDIEHDLDPKDSLLRRAVEEKTKENQKNYKAWAAKTGISSSKNTDPGYLRLQAFYLERLEKSRQELKELKDKLDEGAINEEIRLQKLITTTNTAAIQKPVFIAYGVGDNLKDWCAPQCFGKLMGAEYNFNTEGVRTIKLSYTAIGIHPNLSELGISPLGELGYGTITEGYSHRIFNEEDFLLRNERLFEEVDNKVADDTSFFKELTLTVPLKDIFKGKLTEGLRGIFNPSVWYEPSLHQAISSCMKEFIQKGCNTENVIVLLPNLDLEFFEFFKSIKDEAKIQKLKSSYGFTLGVWKEALEDIGLDLVEYREGEDGGYAAIGNNHYGAIEKIPDSDHKDEFFQKTTFKVGVQVDNVAKTFEDKLKQVSESLAGKIGDFPMSIRKEGAQENLKPNDKYYSSNLPSMKPPKLIVETDFNIIQLMLKHGLIKDGSKEVIIWGSDDMVDLFLHGELGSRAESLLEKDDDGLVSIKGLQRKILALAERNLNPADETTFGANISQAYIKDVFDYTFPSPWIAPFGPTGRGGGDDYFLSEDMSILKDSLVSTKLKKIPSALERQPVFAFGTKNSNVLGVDIDINKQYMTLLTNAEPSINTGAAIADAIVPLGFESPYNTMWENFNKIDFDNIDKVWGVPVDFVKIALPFLHVDNKAESVDINGLGEWELVFNAMRKAGKFEDMNNWSIVGKKTSSSAHQIVVEEGSSGWETTYGNNRMGAPGGGAVPSRKKISWDPTAKKKKAIELLFDAFTTLFEQAGIGDGARWPKSKKIYPGKDPSQAAISNYARIMDRMLEMTLTGNITTIPMFSLCNMKRVITKPCKLLCIEPQMFNQNNSNTNLLSKKHLTWFSGAYKMMGFKHTISNSNAKSEFLIVRPGAYDTKPEGVSDLDSDSGEPEDPAEVHNGS